MKQLNVFKRLYYRIKIGLYNFFKYRSNNVHFKLYELYGRKRPISLDLDTNNTQEEQGLSLEQVKYCVNQWKTIKNSK